MGNLTRQDVCNIVNAALIKRFAKVTEDIDACHEELFELQTQLTNLQLELREKGWSGMADGPKIVNHDERITDLARRVEGLESNLSRAKR